jgi:3'-phosphoadenosine 5'-phosphosulfate (PAPS) 3'-phosphatase
MAPDDDELARRLADRAGEMLVALRAELGFADAELLKSRGDSASHELLAAALRDARPADAVLSEEAADDRARLAAERVWIIDPLDGTKEYAQAGREDWAVHVALWVRGELAAGAVALPAQGRTFSTAAPPAPPRWSAYAPILVSRSRAPEFLHRVASLVAAPIAGMGSAGAKTAEVVAGTARAYLHAGGQYEWDSAAPVAVARAAGLHASRLDGAPLEYNRADPYLPDLLICHPTDTAELLDAVAKAVADT